MLTSNDTIEGGVSDWRRRPYLRQIRELKENEKTTVTVDFSKFMESDHLAAEQVQLHYYRLEPYLRMAVQDLVKKYCIDYYYVTKNAGFETMLDTQQSYAELQTGAPRDFWVSFYNLPRVARLRELRGSDVGKLESISGTVTRTSEVRPELLLGAFECCMCQSIAKDVEQQFIYTEPIMCQNATCQNRTTWQPLLEMSKFCDWQKVRIQEKENEIPSGAMPRSLDVILRNDMVERARAGDRVRFTGTVIVIPDVSQISMPGRKVERVRNMPGRENDGVSGLKSLGVRDMGYNLAFLCSYCESESSDALDDDDLKKVMSSFTVEETDHMRQMMGNKTIYADLVRSIAPQVFGHDEIKRGILLQLVSGVHKVTTEGMNLRGDLNVCLVGDPSTAKSQFLKFVASFAPRSVFTSGKSASAAGLTAAVVKDEETGDFTIEAGALMLADNGICCIDEFDKMDIRDQVAIHEAMEQQTISIAKAGIHATLNARTSILAAANPIRGRYDKRLTLRQNIAMSAPIMSRFDLFFVVLDECDPATDVNIAQHLVNMHRFQNALVDTQYSTDQIKNYIRFARTLTPRIRPETAELLKVQYKQLRNDNDGKSHRITVRQLESMIRLSEALARIHCDTEVRTNYAAEAYRLIKRSILHVESETKTVELDEVVEKAILPESQTKQKMVITSEELGSMAKMFVSRLRQEDEGLKKSNLIQWYLEQMEDELMTEEDIEKYKKKASLVIRHLIRKTNTLIELNPNEFDIQNPQEINLLDPTLVLNPMCFE